MCPDGDYKLGHEKEAGRLGNAPILLYDLLPFELSFLIVPILLARTPFYPPVSIPFTFTGIILWLIITTTLAFIIQVVFQLFLRHRYRDPYSKNELYSILAKASRRIDDMQDFEFWLLPSYKQVFLPLTGFFYRSIIISPRVEEDLLASPDAAEVIFADVIVQMKSQRFLRLWLPIVIFVAFSVWTVHWVGFTTNLAVSLAWMIYGFLVIVSLMRVVFGRAPSKNHVLDEYSVHPDVARCRVFRGTEPTESEMKEMSKKLHDPLSKEVDRTRGFLLFLAALIISILVAIVLTSWELSFNLTNLPQIDWILPFLTMILSLVTFEVLFSYPTRTRYEDDESTSDL